MIVALVHVCTFPHVAWWVQFLHPGELRTPCGGYWMWSGIGSDIGEVTLIGAIIVAIRHRNCHVDGCKSVRTSHDPVVHAPACRKHHSHGHLHGIDPHKTLTEQSQEVDR